MGFQQQPSPLRTVEGEFKSSFRKTFKRNISINPAGRTDCGVHALGQVLNFKMDKEIHPEKLKIALNANLPEDIRVLSTEIVPDNFHARYSSKSRTYYYYFTQNLIPPFLQRYVTVVKYDFDFSMTPDICQTLIGEHDFSNFRSKGSFQSSTIKTIYDFKMTKTDMMTLNSEPLNYPLYTISITGSGFLYKMVRNVVGSVFEVLRGKRSVVELRQQLSEKKKAFLYTTVPAQGLWLIKVEY